MKSLMYFRPGSTFAGDHELTKRLIPPPPEPTGSLSLSASHDRTGNTQLQAQADTTTWVCKAEDDVRSLSLCLLLTGAHIRLCWSLCKQKVRDQSHESYIHLPQSVCTYTCFWMPCTDPDSVHCAPHESCSWWCRRLCAAHSDSCRICCCCHTPSAVTHHTAAERQRVSLLMFLLYLCVWK